MRISFYPNPLDSFGLAESIARWKATFLPIVPNFLKKLFQVARKEQLSSLRFFPTGGEKAPEELFDKVKALDTGAVLLEGYGLSETNTLLSSMQVGQEPKGVGQILPGVKVCTIDPETQKPLPQGSVGLLCVQGPNVFQGYLGDAPSPFIEIDGEKWFKTGDIGYLDADETLYLTGRLKRFVKIGGEMISLKAVEDALLAGCRKQNRIQNEEVSLAVSAEEKEAAGATLTLFAVFSIDVVEANEILREKGFSNLIKITRVEKVDEIPLMGNGKTNYRALASFKKTPVE